MKISIKKLLRNTFFPSYAHISTCLFTPHTHTHIGTHMFEFSEKEERSSIWNYSVHDFLRTDESLKKWKAFM